MNKRKKLWNKTNSVVTKFTLNSDVFNNNDVNTNLLQKMQVDENEERDDLNDELDQTAINQQKFNEN